MRVRLAITLSLVLLPTTAAAQSEGLAPGTTVRATYRTGPVPLERLLRLEVRGEPTAGAGARRGLLWGAGLGAIAGFALGGACAASTGFFGCSAVEVGAITVTVAGIGAGTGAAIDALVGARDWREVPVPAGAAP